ncbi:PolC-type DNA polymerase III [Flagellimonas allohymeniacidonis]|uniref:3'-5' exonuclease n=1 Tax=Flagellimonas allohymeniacidonis TaxID=2517819 RepID=A0A4Q8QK42_9FLAO|nr:3'-5' exonuclease [Allomuricauda hymeniacidonis]TAI48606.1 3'-5' exonuclease [Allomuricauda hymeniacidonis]
MKSRFKREKKEVLPNFWWEYQAKFSEEEPKEIEQTTFVLWDTETTGFNVTQDRILCIGAVKLLNGMLEVKNSFEVFLSQNYYDAETAKIHGILKKEKTTCLIELDALKQFLDYIGNAVLVGHHVLFDVNMINEALNRLGLPKLKNKTLDTSLLYKQTLLATSMLQKKEQYTLDELAEKFDISKKDRHTALGDALITAYAFMEILQRLKPKDIKELFKKQYPPRFSIW